MLPSRGHCLLQACGSRASLLQVAFKHQPAKKHWTERLPTRIGLRRWFAEKTANRYNEERVKSIGPDLACLEWLMHCGASEVRMSCGTSIKSISAMNKYLKQALAGEIESPAKIAPGDLAHEEAWPNAPRVYVLHVDASDSAIANPGFAYFRNLRRVEVLKLNFCDYFGDDGLRELAMGRPKETLRNLEIVLNPNMTDGAIFWLSRLVGLRRAHFYFLPYVANRPAFLRHLRTALPKAQVTFPEIEFVGYGYDEARRQNQM
ncbi:unnamed protein product, partial [Mesorhabditis spiculigera]